ncbi:FCD domain-containing protein [Yoonia sp. 2307UL14-13]|uniref:FCD domain-containing protein n=1 Tax=Yoonia sp. 2307UL14-13 TaxID=3126506 RepID=UPI0030B2BF7F
MTRKIKGASAADATARHLEDLILEGSLRSGDSLLSERDMAAHLDVSRPVLREALKTLEQKGLLKPAAGGRVVAELATSVTDPLMDLLEERKDMAKDYLELRGVLEQMAASLAAKRATDVDRRALEDCAREIDAAHATGDATQEAEADLNLHMIVYEASHNIVLLHMMRALSKMLRKGVFLNRLQLYALPEVRAILRDQHLKIIETILSRDPAKAGEAAAAHMTYTKSALAEIAAAEERLQMSLRRIDSGGLGAGTGGG